MRKRPQVRAIFRHWSVTGFWKTKVVSMAPFPLAVVKEAYKRIAMI